ELHYLANSEVSVVSVSIDHSNLVSMLQRARMEQKRMQRIDRALALGSSIELMQTFFGLSSTDVAARRRIAGIEARSGR
ncbi:STY4526/YPO1902 family pathogenicity island replication protein, partial [Salmonella sp. SAL4443]